MLADMGDAQAQQAHQTWMDLLESQDPPYVVGCYYLRNSLNPNGTYQVGLMYDPDCDISPEVSAMPIMLAQMGHHLTPIVKQRRAATTA
jgi:hypothetical protein